MASPLSTRTGKSGLREAERPPANLFLLLAVSFFLTIASIYGAQASVFEKARSSLLDRFAPVLELFSAPVRFVEARVGEVGHYFAVLDENERLRQENEELRIFMQQAAAMQERLVEYEALLDPKVIDPKRYIPAQVIASNGGPFRRALILSAGARDGIRQGHAVVDGSGLIGHVVTVGDRASRVLLLTDANSHIPVYVKAANVEGLLTGTAEARAEIRDFSGPPQAELQVGMQVVTSGTGGALPRGLPVGRVSKLVDGGVEVDLFASEQGAFLVRVVDYQFPDPDVQADNDKLARAAIERLLDGDTQASSVSGRAPRGDDERASAPLSVAEASDG